METKFNFASFDFPRKVALLPRATPKIRMQHKKSGVAYKSQAAGYYTNGNNAGTGTGFYLEATDGGCSFNLRWKWADETAACIHHTGWFCDDYQDDKLRGIVLRLPRSRGFLAGYSMGEQMASYVETSTYETERDAALAADSLAQEAAEEERESREEEEAKRKAEEEEEERKTLCSALCSMD